MLRVNGITNLKRTARRSMYGPAPDMRACTSLVTVDSYLSPDKVAVRIREIHGRIALHLGSKPIIIHGEMSLNSGGKRDDKCYQYLSKLRKLEDVLVRAKFHLESKSPNRLILREYLNELSDGNDYGSSVMVVIPEKEKSSGFCTFEVSSCHFKHRETPNRADLLKQIKFILKNLYVHMEDFKSALTLWK